MNPVMPPTDKEINDELREEYDLSVLRIRKMGPGRQQAEGISVHLDPDVAVIFKDAQSVNEALRFLIRVSRQYPAALSS